ncbi:uncharacterized protein LOC125196435 isoform X2 [Salvia hispanica]|nr:uncharacterized protein LOC125196435 isoform X2 [Salvia hispanica]
MSEARTYTNSIGGSQGTQGGGQYHRSSMQRGDRVRRSWSDREEALLISGMKALVARGWKSDNGFRGGYANKIEEWITREIPTTDLKAEPHIKSKITSWKKNYYSLAKILDRSGVGFNLHNDFKIDCSDDQWDQIVKQDSNARTMRYKAWPLWDEWKIIFGKDRATGGTSEGIGEAVTSNSPEEPLTSIGESGDYYPSFEDFLGNETIQPAFTQDVVEDTSAQSGQNVAAPANPPPPKKVNRKRKSSDDDFGLFTLLGQLHSDTKARLDTLAVRIGYEMDLGTARKEIFRHLGNIPDLTEAQRYDLCDIIGKENSRLEIFIGLPDASKPGYVKRILEKEARY